MTKQEEMMLRAEGLRRMGEEQGWEAVKEHLEDWQSAVGGVDTQGLSMASGFLVYHWRHWVLSPEGQAGLLLGAYLASGRICPVPPEALSGPYAEFIGDQVAEGHAKYHEQRTKLPSWVGNEFPKLGLSTPGPWREPMAGPGLQAIEELQSALSGRSGWGGVFVSNCIKGRASYPELREGE